MMKSGSKGRMLGLCTAFVLSLSSMAYAQSFTDVPADYWAKDQIEKAVEKGLMFGRGDGTVFEPNADMTKVEAMVTLSNFYKISDAEKTAAITQYKSLFDKLKVPATDREGLAIALAKGLTTSGAVEATFYEKGKATVLIKDEACIFIARAMGLENEVKAKAFVSLNFKDLDLMPLATQAYVETMVEKGLVDGKGDAQGRFNPKSAMTRGVMAKMVTTAYDLTKIEVPTTSTNTNTNNTSGATVTNNNTGTSTSGTSIVTNNNTNTANNNTNTVSNNTTESPKVSYEKWASDLLQMSIQDGRLALQLEDLNRGKGWFTLASNAIVTINGNIADSSNLKEKMILEAVVSSKGEITEIQARTYANTYAGKIDKIEKTGERSVKVSYIENGLNKVKTINVTADTEILVDGFKDDLANLFVGNEVQIRSNDRQGIQVIKVSPERTISATFKEVIYNKDKAQVVVQKGENIYRYALANLAVPMARNGKSAKVYDLRAGDTLSLTLAKNEVKKIEASAVTTKVQGTIKSIVFDMNGSHVEIEHKSGDVKTYEVTALTNIDIGTQKNKLVYDLRVGYSVDLDIQSGEVISIVTDAAGTSLTMSGKALQVFAGEQLIIFETKEGETLYLKADSTTKFISMDGKNINLSNMASNSSILVSLEKMGNAYKAKQIIVIE